MEWRGLTSKLAFQTDEWNMVGSIIVTGLLAWSWLHFGLSQQLHHFRVLLSLSCLSTQFKQNTRRTGEKKNTGIGMNCCMEKKKKRTEISDSLNVCLTYSTSFFYTEHVKPWHPDWGTGLFFTAFFGLQRQLVCFYKFSGSCHL